MARCSKSTTSTPTTARSRRSRASRSTVDEGEIVTLIGSNGAGKSTTLRSISGLTPPRTGSIRFRGQEISTTAGAGDRPPRHLAVARGPALLPAHDRAREPRARRLPAPRRERHERPRPRVRAVPAPEASARRQKAGTMSGGEQQMLAMGRALMADPKLLLLDEPSMGLAPILVDRIYETIAEINKQGTTILLVEQNANYALEVSNRGYVLETGKVVLTDKSPRSGQPRSPEGVPGHMTDLRPPRRRRALAHLLLAAVGDRRALPVPAQGLRRAAGPRLRAAAQRDRRRIWLVVPRQAGVAVEADRPLGPRPSIAARPAWHGGAEPAAAPPRRAPRTATPRLNPPPRAVAARRGTGTETSTLPPSPARGVTLHHRASPAVVDHEPVGVAEEAGALRPGLLLELRCVRDAVVAAALRRGSRLAAAGAAVAGTSRTACPRCRRRASRPRRAAARRR